jgi:HSP20 family protein
MTVPRRTPRAPLSALALLQQEVNALFDRLALVDRSERIAGGEWSPGVDVFEVRGRVVVVMEVPGLALDAVHVLYREREIVVSGERRARRPGAGTAVLCMERAHGQFERTIPLNVAVDVTQAQASLKGGLLTITLPRLKERRGREIVIPIEGEQEE